MWVARGRWRVPLYESWFLRVWRGGLGCFEGGPGGVDAGGSLMSMFELFWISLPSAGCWWMDHCCEVKRWLLLKGQCGQTVWVEVEGAGGCYSQGADAIRVLRAS